MVEEKKIGYTIGVSGGIFGAATQEERFAFTSVGLAKKAQYAITKGVQFVQIDLESSSEFEEFDLKKKMNDVKRLGIRFGVHAETPSFGSREFPHLDSAVKPDYRRSHERLLHAIEESAKIGAVYFLVHSSESTPFQFLSKEFQPSDLVDPWGRDLSDFIKDHDEIYIDKGEDDIRHSWLWRQTELWKDVFHQDPDPALDQAEIDSKLRLKELARRELVAEKIKDMRIDKINEMLNKEFGAGQNEIINKIRNLEIVANTVPDEKRGAVISQLNAVIQERKKLEEDFENKKKILEATVVISPEEAGKEIDKIQKLADERISTEAEITWKKQREEFIKTETLDTYKQFLRLIQSRNLTYGPEKIAYYILARWMEKTAHDLWMPIINITIDYYARKDRKTREQWIKDKGIKNISIDDPVFQKDYRLWVPSVSALYVYGHFFPKNAPSSRSNAKPEFEIKSPIEILEKYGIYFIFETPMAGSGMEDLLRFPQPAQMYYLVKSMNSKYFGIAVDIEHMLMDGLNVEAAIDILPSDSGKWIRVIHSGYPSPLGPAHIPIPLGSDQQLYLYKTYWKLRQKGMGRENEVFVIFERTGGHDPIQQSVIALRLIKKFLEMDYPPEKLPLEFFGLEPGQWASSERQRVAILEHAYDPLKGMLQVPEEEHGFLGKTVIDKGKGEEWRKEKYR